MELITNYYASLLNFMSIPNWTPQTSTPTDWNPTEDTPSNWENPIVLDYIMNDTVVTMDNTTVTMNGIRVPTIPIWTT